VPAGKLDDMVAPRCDSPDLDIEAVDAPVGIPHAAPNEAAAHEPILIFAIAVPLMSSVRTAL